MTMGKDMKAHLDFGTRCRKIKLALTKKMQMIESMYSKHVGYLCDLKPAQTLNTSSLFLSLPLMIINRNLSYKPH